jgi:uncharacterized protein (TIGR00369 family)
MKEERKRVLSEMFHDRTAITRLFGMKLHFEGNSAVVVLPYNPELNHAADGVHGGVFMTLLDTAAWFTAALSRKEGSWLTTSEMSVHFLKPASRTGLKCVGRMLKSGRRQDIVEAHLYDASGELVGHGVGTMIVLQHISSQ